MHLDLYKNLSAFLFYCDVSLFKLISYRKKDFVMRFLDLCDKEVININNCCYLGHVRDMEFDECNGCICAIIVPGPGKYMGCFCREMEYVIPWCNIVRIGPDIVLVNLKDEMKHKI